MQLQLTNPEFERFIDSKVKSGSFPTPESVVEDALLRMMDDEVTLTPEDLAAIKEADEAIDRGEFVDFNDFAARVRKKFGITK